MMLEQKKDWCAGEMNETVWLALIVVKYRKVLVTADIFSYAVVTTQRLEILENKYCLWTSYWHIQNEHSYDLSNTWVKSLL